MVDTGGLYLFCMPSVARALHLEAAQALGAQTILFRDERVRGTLHRLTLTLLAEEGADLQLDVTAFVPDAGYENVPDLSSILGVHSWLERVRFACDPATDTFLLGSRLPGRVSPSGALAGVLHTRGHPPPSAWPCLPVVQHAGQFRRCRPRILHGVGRLPVPELLLYGGNIAGLGDNMLAHGMPRTMGRPPLDLRDATDRIPDGIDHPDRQASCALRHRGGRQEQRWRGPPRGVLHALMPKIVRDGLGPLPTDLIGM